MRDGPLDSLTAARLASAAVRIRLTSATRKCKTTPQRGGTSSTGRAAADGA